MPQSKHQILRYRIIDRELSKKRYVKTKNLLKILSYEFDIEVTQKTIQNDISAMMHDSQLGYFAPIEYCHKHKAYYYADTDCFRGEILEEVYNTSYTFKKKNGDIVTYLIKDVERVKRNVPCEPPPLTSVRISKEEHPLSWVPE